MFFLALISRCHQTGGRVEWMRPNLTPGGCSARKPNDPIGRSNSGKRLRRWRCKAPDRKVNQ